MTEKKIKVPEGMLDAAYREAHRRNIHEFDTQLGAILEAALRWLSENPIVPTDEDQKRLTADWLESRGRISPDSRLESSVVFGAVESQRRMFLAKPDLDEPINPTAEDWERANNLRNLGLLSREGLMAAYRELSAVNYAYAREIKRSKESQ